MGEKKGAVLAELSGMAYLEKGGPFEGCGAVGEKKGYPLAVDWTKRKKQTCVAFTIRFKKGSLKVAPAELPHRLLEDAELLKAAGKKKFSTAERNAAVAGEDRVTMYWDYSMRAPRPEAVAAAADAIVRFMGDHSAPVGEGCDQCGAESGGMLHCLEGMPTVLCGACSERVRADNMEKERAWEAVEPRLGAGLLAGAAVAIAAALAWGGLAYSTNRIYVALALGIGFCIATTIKFAMRKVTGAGKVAAFVLTVASVLGGDFFFVMLAVAKAAKVGVSSDLARRVLPHFFEIQFSDASGYLSVLFGVLGAIAALAFLKQKAPGRELVLVQR